MNKLLLAAIFVLTSISTFSQTYLVNQHFSNVAPTGWSSTSNVWSFTYNGSSTTNYRNVFDATTYSARFSSAATGNSIYLYIPINFVSGNTYTITFYTKRVCSVAINTNELPNQTTLLSTETQTNSSCNSNWNTWYQWSTTILSSYTGAGYFQIWTKTIYGGPTSAYLDDVSIYESEPVNLPIELLYFKGSVYNSDNILHWSTASEDNNDYFTIEKTKDGIDWEIVTRESGGGNSSNQLYYSSVDENVESIINYYRLKQTDYDGRFKYSDIISIDNRRNLESKEIVKITNILGQEVDLQYYRGLIIIYYTDGSSNKIIK
jgi:hypothetical protein